MTELTLPWGELAADGPLVHGAFRPSLVDSVTERLTLIRQAAV
jgi:hypothetical protein